MSRFRSWLTPAIAAALVIVVAIAVVVLLRVANANGTKALERAKLAQVQATANSFNARVASGLQAVQGLGAQPWQLTPGSAHDTQTLNSYNVDPNAQSGAFLVDSSDTIVNGYLLRPGKLGSKYAPPDWDKAKQTLASTPAVALPVTPSGETTELPNYAFVVAIRGATPTSVRGAFVFETALTTTSSFQQEIAQLADRNASSASWFFLDGKGVVIATTDVTGLGKPADDPRYTTVPAGESHLGKRLVFAADVPSVGWRVVFREDRSQFVGGLSGPLQKAGLILVLLLLLVGLTLVVLLVRRLRESQEQERRLRLLNESQEEFISVVSHELRTPVSGVLGFLQTAIDHWDGLDDEGRKTTVRRAVTNARRLQAMTRDVLDTESIESGRFGYVWQPVDLETELRTAVEGVEGIDAAHRVQLVPPSRPITVEADPDRLQQVLANLLENARNNAPASEPIAVETTIVDDKVQVSVIDRGPGVRPESLERIFDKFVRGRDGSVAGTGLGLYIVRRIVEAHHGRIWCESTPGVRTAFTFELPIIAKASPATRSADEPEPDTAPRPL
ncbi:MAG TPA: HAMP domain-containing sensor histidine kinase [Mycobacteriales bacterium]|nr:HAMP domain-containing sensor histidine kinase [Mycobacteriales bacterium]